MTKPKTPDRFDAVIPVILRSEGGYVNDSADPGGETKFGISKAAYPTVDIKGLTEEKAKAIYRRDYWEKPRIDRLPAPIDLAVFDAAVNKGPGVAIKLLQTAVGADQDGIIGPQTLDAVTIRDPEATFRRYLAIRAIYYSRLGGFPRFGLGWMTRLMALAREA